MISLLLVYFPEMAHAGVKQKQFVDNNCYFLSNFEKYSFLIKMQAKVLLNTKNQWRYTEVSFCTNMQRLFDFTSYSLLEKELRGAILMLTRMHLFLVFIGSYIFLAITTGKGTANQICHRNQAGCKASEKREGVSRCLPFTVGCRRYCRHTGIAGGLSASLKPAAEIRASPHLFGPLWRFCYKQEDSTISWQTDRYFSGIKP